MSNGSKLMTFFVFLIIQESTFSEWVEMPQFSNSGKVYRMPFATRHDAPGQKYHQDNRDGPNVSVFSKIHEHGNATLADGVLRRPLKHHHQLAEMTTESAFFDVPSSTNVLVTTTAKSVDSSYRNETVSTEKPRRVEHNFERVVVQNEKEESSQTPSVDHPDDDESIIDDREHDEPEVDEKTKKTNFLAYLPMELFKKVHNILKSQSTSNEGKIDFLKRFEKTLLGEIEKRLVPVFTSAREKRQARGDHGWDDHDKSVGFPSLEGALMTIAFLTFAVYLIQLVMMLFPNLGTRGVSAILFNRNRRSVDEFTEDTARILAYLDEYARRQRFQ